MTTILHTSAQTCVWCHPILSSAFPFLCNGRRIPFLFLVFTKLTCRAHTSSCSTHTYKHTPRQVYEHVYKTVDAVGSVENRATATAKATVAAFAASEGQGHPRVVEFEKVKKWRCVCVHDCNLFTYSLLKGLVSM